ncbi:hypothetical protein XA68_13027 [Ophiocordyceps unilateralis]|uniref:Zinc finger PHD-type domain-containing protein n=1 Tax=Ophiocordyceps unilateralis TaxID=268505 RepID=A0A2A9PCC6_OPHUN|nr:hypothetical protein XA68_13027 [Ophiocordyceps unilateralis]
MSSRKRPIQAVDDAAGGASGDDASTTLSRIRNMWQFANLCQWIYIFGKAAKIDESIDVEDIEADCLKPNQTLLMDLALAILKLVSSHRGLNHDIMDDQLQKQYLMRAPDRIISSGDNCSSKFADMSVFQKIVVLQQLTQWAMANPERIRDLMGEQKDADQMSWRIEPYGWDKEDRTYFVLDDNRVYRLTDRPPTQARVKPKSKSTKSRRVNRRKRGVSSRNSENDVPNSVDDGLDGRMWDFAKTRDENEKVLRQQLETHLVPILEKLEETQKRKQAQRERELLNMAKMANAKRSSRLAGKAEKRKMEEQAKEEEQKEREAEELKILDEQKRQRLERDRDFRMFSRQRRLQEREARRLQHKEDLAQLSEDSRHASTSAGRVSERRLEAEIERTKQSLQNLDREEEEWAFDCVCGLFGQVDDGNHCVACERCNVWQHSECLGISEAEADRPEFQFVCDSCKRQDGGTSGAPFKPVKLKLNPTRSSKVTGSSRTEQAQDTQSVEQRARGDDASKLQKEVSCSGASLFKDKDSAPEFGEAVSPSTARPTGSAATEPASRLTSVPAVDTREPSASSIAVKQNGHESLTRLGNGSPGATIQGSPLSTLP